ncbi:hypothetical protein KKB18_09890 [bacterium]|nr:hypothetical protein [bacterium]
MKKICFMLLLSISLLFSFSDFVEALKCDVSPKRGKVTDTYDYWANSEMTRFMEIYGIDYMAFTPHASLYINGEYYATDWNYDNMTSVDFVWEDVPGSILKLGMNYYSFYIHFPQVGPVGGDYGPFVMDELMHFDLKIPEDSKVFTLLMDMVTAANWKTGKIYFVMLGPNNEVYSAPDWSSGIVPLVTIDFPKYYEIKDVQLIGPESSLLQPSMTIPVTYTFAIGVFDAWINELISNIATVEFKVE